MFPNEWDLFENEGDLKPLLLVAIGLAIETFGDVTIENVIVVIVNEQS